MNPYYNSENIAIEIYKLGIKVTSTKRVQKHIPSLLASDEQILAYLECNLKGENGYWAAILTQKRIFLAKKSFFGSVQEYSFQPKRIHTVKDGRWFFDYKLSFIYGKQVIELTCFNQKAKDIFLERLKEVRFGSANLPKKSSSSNKRYISKQVQRSVWQRDGGRCVECGSQKNLEFDHIVPVSRGGSNSKRNVQLLCQSCNRAKSNRIGG